jgi:plastocyanin
MKEVAVLLALASFACSAFVACGDEETTTSGRSTAVVLVDRLGNDFSYKTKAVSAKAGDVRVVLKNPQREVRHDVRIEDSSGAQLGGTDVITEGSDSVLLEDLDKGEYSFYCSVPGHRTAGMEGALVVE